MQQPHDTYVKKYGRIGTDKKLKKIFEQDSSYPLLCSLEIFKGNEFIGKSDIFTKRTINPYIVPDHADTAADALTISMQEKGKVNLSYMESLTDIPHKELVQQLEFTSIYYDIEKNDYQLADEYLSGDICAKIEYLENLSLDLERQKEDIIHEILTPWSEVPAYEAKNDTEERLLNNRYPNIDDRTYFNNHIDDVEFILTVLGKSSSYSALSVPEQYKSDPLFALKAYKYGRNPNGMTKGEKLLKKICKEIEPEKKCLDAFNI
jgi:hypothetical protein